MPTHITATFITEVYCFITYVTGFAQTIPIGTTIEIHFMAYNIKATLSHCPGTPSTRAKIAEYAFTEGFSRACQTMKVHHRAC